MSDAQTELMEQIHEQEKAADAARELTKMDAMLRQQQVGGDHYTSMAIQPVEFCYANAIPFIEGCVIKYICRHRAKGGRADLEKAKHFIDMLIDLEYRNRDEARMASVCVYVAGAYSSDPEGNTGRAIALANHLLDLGYAVMVPHLTHYLHLGSERPYEEWLAHGLEMLTRCDVLLWDQFRLPGLSPGANAEVVAANEWGIPVMWSVEGLCKDFPLKGAGK